MVTPPVEQIKNPLLQKVLSCFPEKKAPYSFNIDDADLAFSFPIMSESGMAGDVSKIKWIWSSPPLISIILHLTNSEIFLRVWNRKSRFSEVSK